MPRRERSAPGVRCMAIRFKRISLSSHKSGTRLRNGGIMGNNGGIMGKDNNR